MTPKKSVPENNQQFLGKFLLNTTDDIFIREPKTIPPHKTAVRVDSKTIVWRVKSKHK